MRQRNVKSSVTSPRIRRSSKSSLIIHRFPTIFHPRGACVPLLETREHTHTHTYTRTRKLSLRILSNRKKKKKKEKEEKQREVARNGIEKGQQKLDERALVTIAAKSGSTARNATCMYVCVCVCVRRLPIDIYPAIGHVTKGRFPRCYVCSHRVLSVILRARLKGPVFSFVCFFFWLSVPLSRRPATGVIGVVDRGCARNPVAIRDSLRFATVKRQFQFSLSFSLLCSLCNVAVSPV